MPFERRLTTPTEEVLGGFRATLVDGPRQAGKSTLVTQVQRGRGPVVTLDDPAILASVRHDPVGFLKTLEPQVAIDDFQRGGDDLLLALKAAIDRSDTRGQYLLTGSTRFLTTRTLSETLTGRIGLVELLPTVGGRTPRCARALPRPSLRRRGARRNANAPTQGGLRRVDRPGRLSGNGAGSHHHPLSRRVVPVVPRYRHGCSQRGAGGRALGLANWWSAT